ncbi:TetR/AcrR family transcriptional regulator [Dechloromonas denitrificans]|uniref:TetR/AcrR family transcriptional regulator n=1 Tax=Dechloromonas denitrificans TaxID=281362 RepID=UPI001CFBF8AF|nr:TetR/AcrR family transcriptional regulator [Dechloromonas denitrificans]UCV05958.1 TetR/AcrR family transcriptional regulator [Dechloromonas denitrificans]
MDTAEKILNAALAEFYQNGFHASGVDQLSSKAGVTKRTLYRHFPSKECLIDSVLQLRDEQFMERLQAFVDAAPRPERPMAYLDFLESWGKEADFHGCMFINAAAEYSAPTDPPHLAAIAHKERVLSYLGRICEEAELADAGSLATQLFVIGEGLIVVMQVMGHSPLLISSTRQVFTQLIETARTASPSECQLPP